MLPYPEQTHAIAAHVGGAVSRRILLKQPEHVVMRPASQQIAAAARRGAAILQLRNCDGAAAVTRDLDSVRSP